ncbi:hypothetical protein EC957_012073 [Mortierella hygrophila]|uniref:Uncharacterized protein n=1 Tax=Mortierella hygrophila TaxID=979708 RepID=A0A9P6F7Y3_9FUNG|nr:hypothetical protein EC957_012073 [Mortierella hygrophila]
MDRSYFEDALGIVRTVLQKRINHAAQISLANDILCIAAGLRSASLVDQLFLNENDVDRIQSMFHHSARYNHLDLLVIGDDHVFIIHRQLLLQDIRDYLSGTSEGIQRVFVNVDYHLAQPEIMPDNRYKALEDYIRNILLVDVQHRIQNWDQAEYSYQPLTVPDRLSLVTLTGWLLSYPINYVLPGQGRRYSSGSTDSSSTSPRHYNEDEEDDEQDNGRNALANQVLVVTRVHLEPNVEVEGLREHCLLSFSYPSELAERFMDRNTPPPSSPISPVVERSEYDFTTGGGDDEKKTDRSIPFKNGNSELSPRLPSSESFDQNRPLPFSNPDICAAGRSFLTHLHSRFLKQTIWKGWQVGQQNVVLPVVAM